MKYFISIAAIVAFVFFTACSETFNTSGKDIIFPDSNVSFQAHVYPFLKLNCSYAGCHSDESAAGGIILTYYSTLFQTPGMIVLEDPDRSRLVQTIENTLPHYTFYYRGNITDNHKKGIRTWINEGSKNN